MRKMYLIMICVAFIMGLASGCSKGYQTQKAVDDLTVILSVGSYPLVKGDNTLMLKVADPAGKAQTDAHVDVRFYMPPMPGMSPMEFTVQATLKGNAYIATVNPPMEGGWKAEIDVARPGKPTVTASFNLDVR